MSDQLPSSSPVAALHKAWRTLLQAPATELGLAHLIRLVRLRWLAMVGQLCVIGVAQLLLGVRLPLLPLLSVVALLGFYNLLTGWRIRQVRRRALPIAPHELFTQLFVDLVGLSALLFFSGGATNPFVSFYLPALAIAATILPWVGLLALSVFALLCYTAMSFEYLPLDLVNPNNAVPYHLAGMWVNFVASVGLIVLFVARLSYSLRQRDAALAKAQETMLRDERMVALGAQAASIAHDLGTPLSTVAILTDELQHEVAHDPHLAPYADDFRDMQQQIALMQQALQQLQQGSVGAAPTQTTPLGALLPDFAKQWRLRHPHANLTLELSDACAALRVDQAVVQQILTVLLDNAARSHAQAGRAALPIVLRVEMIAQQLRLMVLDWGTGLPAQFSSAMHELGNAPLHSTAGGQGLGLYLARTAARRLGGDLQLSAHHTTAALDGATVSSGICASLSLPVS